MEGAGKNNRTALSISIGRRHMAVARTLVHGGAKINVNLQKMFDQAASAGNTEIMSILHRVGADPNGERVLGKSLLLGAIDGHCDKTIKFLLSETQEDVNLCCREIIGEPPITRAVINNDEELALQY